MLVFTFSVMPKHYLHDLFSQHIHTYNNVPDDGRQYIVQAGIVCDCVDLVVSSPYLSVDTIEWPVFQQTYHIKHSVVESHIYALPQYFFSLQGPPSLA